MFGIPGVSLGAILRVKDKDYKDIALVALFYAIIAVVVSMVSLAIFGSQISELIPLIPETVAPILTGITLVIFGGALVGVYAFISLLWGAIVMDLIDWFLRVAK